MVRERFPGCIVVWNPVNESRFAKPIPGTHLELHGPTVELAPPCIANLDGVDISFPSRPNLLPEFIVSAALGGYLGNRRPCALTFLWIAEHNGLTGDGPFIDPRKRVNFPTAETFAILARTLAQFGGR
jgi:hypothetical protein